MTRAGFITLVTGLFLVLSYQSAPLVYAQNSELQLSCVNVALCEADSIAQLITSINKARASSRCKGKRTKPAGKLRLHSDLQRAAISHAVDMAENGFLNHTGSDGKGYQHRVGQTGYRWSNVAENLAAGQTETVDVLDVWLESREHCNLMLSSDYQDAGLACAINCNAPYRIYWALILASPQY